MNLQRLTVATEYQAGKGSKGEVFSGDVLELLPELTDRFGEKAQMVYLDPPFGTGGRFSCRVRVGEKDWETSKPSLTDIAYNDNLPRNEYLAMMRQVLEGAKALLNDTGTIFLHIDYRMSAHLRLLMDQVFGEKNFLNEIIWTYQTGGRAKNYFSRKHDVILFYRKNHQYYFDINGAAMERTAVRHNHLKRHVDADGRVYRSIRSGGKVYTYYDDEPVFAGDVWDDVSHMQQKDPQRTGYETQKPVRLLERIVRCGTRPGDLVMDLFSGSGTTLVAAHQLNRGFVGADSARQAHSVMRRRLRGAPVLWHIGGTEGEPLVAASGRVGVGNYEISLQAYEMEKGVSARSFQGMDALDDWSVGYLRDGVYHAIAAERRSKAHPRLECVLNLPALSGEIVLSTGDVLGRRMFYRLNREEMEF